MGVAVLITVMFVLGWYYPGRTPHQEQHQTSYMSATGLVTIQSHRFGEL